MYTARAVFASCPSSSNGCSNPQNISVAVGDDVNFNASVIHMSGGSCGFKQVIDHVALERCTNDDCTSGSRSLSTIVRDEVRNHIARVSRGPGKYFFVLSNLTPNDSGLYRVIVTGTHPNGSKPTIIEQKYWVTVKGEHKSIYNMLWYN